MIPPASNISHLAPLPPFTGRCTIPLLLIDLLTNTPINLHTLSISSSHTFPTVPYATLHSHILFHVHPHPSALCTYSPQLFPYYFSQFHLLCPQTLTLLRTLSHSSELLCSHHLFRALPINPRFYTPNFACPLPHSSQYSTTHSINHPLHWPLAALQNFTFNFLPCLTIWCNHPILKNALYHVHVELEALNKMTYHFPCKIFSQFLLEFWQNVAQNSPINISSVLISLWESLLKYPTAFRQASRIPAKVYLVVKSNPSRKCSWVTRL